MWLCSSGGHTAITLQQLLTAENGIKWPDWGVDICVTDNFTMFTNGKGLWRYTHATDGSNIKNGNDQWKVIATRQPVEQCADWWDYDKLEAISLPPLDYECEYSDSDFVGWRRCKYIGINSRESKKFAVIFDSAKKEYVNNWTGGDLKFRPLDHNRKAEQERREFVKKALESAKKHKAECDVTFAEAMFKDGCRFTQNKAPN